MRILWESVPFIRPHPQLTMVLLTICSGTLYMLLKVQIQRILMKFWFQQNHEILNPQERCINIILLFTEYSALTLTVMSGGRRGGRGGGGGGR